MGKRARNGGKGGDRRAKGGGAPTVYWIGRVTRNRKIVGSNSTEDILRLERVRSSVPSRADGRGGLGPFVYNELAREREPQQLGGSHGGAKRRGGAESRGPNEGEHYKIPENLRGTRGGGR